MKAEGNRNTAENGLIDFFPENTLNRHTTGQCFIFMGYNDTAESCVWWLGLAGKRSAEKRKQQAADEQDAFIVWQGYGFGKAWFQP
jgi:hypothetical protein